MKPSDNNINQLVDHLFRHESGKMISVLSRLLGLQNLEVAQDIVQDTLLQAMNTWGYGTVPDNPDAWLYRVAKNKAIDFLRREKKFKEISPQYAYLLQSEWTLSPTVNNFFLENEIQDSQLRMMFACCHPTIPVESQVALTLKTLCGLSVNEIAKAFLTNDETISKRVYRAKEKIKSEKIELEVPADSELPERVDAVLKSLYLLFNEGYNSSHPEKLIRDDLCEEAMRLCLLLTQHSLTNFPRSKALLSLMCFQSSRLNARLDDKGNIILLKYQDRSRWYRPLIQKGFDYLDAAAEPFEVSAYHFEAAIASLHAAAPSFERTDWKSIYHLYELLYQAQPNPIVAMNKAIASAYAVSKQKALEELQQIKGLETHHLYYASIGEMYFELEQKENAKTYFEKAFSLTNSHIEKQLLLEKDQPLLKRLLSYFCWMQLTEVISPQLAKEFIAVNVEINKTNPVYIRPLDKDINDVFDKKKNKTFRQGEVIRWILKNKEGDLIGRIAAFTNKKYKNKGDDVPVGGVGFFDCINSQEAADMLFDVAKHWLMQRGMEAMDGPINFGERDRWWGLVVKGHEIPPMYCMNFNQAYYQQLLENYGFMNYYNQICFAMKANTLLQQKFYDRHAECAKDPNFSSAHIKKNQLDKFAAEFTIVYNKAWAGHGGLKQLEEKVVRKMFQSMKPVMDEQINWFIYYKGDPIGVWINLPDLNQWFKYLNGKFSLWHKLKFLWVKSTVNNKKFTGLVFGIVPEFQGMGADSYLIVEGCRVIQKLKIEDGKYQLGKPIYDDYEMQWIGEFNPKMVNVAEVIAGNRSRILTTYRYLFDRTKEFRRHPILH